MIHQFSIQVIVYMVLKGLLIFVLFLLAVNFLQITDSDLNHNPFMKLKYGEFQIHFKYLDTLKYCQDMTDIQYWMGFFIMETL